MSVPTRVCQADNTRCLERLLEPSSCAGNDPDLFDTHRICSFTQTSLDFMYLNVFEVERKHPSDYVLSKCWQQPRLSQTRAGSLEAAFVGVGPRMLGLRA